MGDGMFERRWISAAASVSKVALTLGLVLGASPALAQDDQAEDQATTAEDGRSPATLDTYKVVVRKMTKYTGDLRLGEATPARLDAALRHASVRTWPGTPRRSRVVRSSSPCWAACWLRIRSAMCSRSSPRTNPRVRWRSPRIKCASC